MGKKGYEEAIERDGGTCRGCGKAYTQVHHIVFRSQGGTHEAENLVCLCDECHRRAHALDARRLSPGLLRATIRTNGNADGMRLKMGICYTCAWVTNTPLGTNVCRVWDEVVAPDNGCSTWKRNPVVRLEDW